MFKKWFLSPWEREREGHSWFLKLTKDLFHFQKDLYAFQIEESTYNCTFSKVSSKKKGGRAIFPPIFNREWSLLILICIWSYNPEAHYTCSWPGKLSHISPRGKSSVSISSTAWHLFSSSHIPLLYPRHNRDFSATDLRAIYLFITAAGALPAINFYQDQTDLSLNNKQSVSGLMQQEFLIHTSPLWFWASILGNQDNIGIRNKCISLNTDHFCS